MNARLETYADEAAREIRAMDEEARIWSDKDELLELLCNAGTLDDIAHLLQAAYATDDQARKRALTCQWGEATFNALVDVVRERAEKLAGVS